MLACVRERCGRAGGRACVRVWIFDIKICSFLHIQFLNDIMKVITMNCLQCLWYSIVGGLLCRDLLALLVSHRGNAGVEIQVLRLRENLELSKTLSLKAWSKSEYSLVCLDCCQEVTFVVSSFAVVLTLFLSNCYQKY